MLAVIVFGLPGSGKSYFAEHLTELLDATYLGSDRLRKELDAHPDYSNAGKLLIYDAMLGRMRSVLQRGDAVVVDATFYRAALRQEFGDAARALGARVEFIEVTASETTVRRRIETPRAESDADFAVFQKVRAQFEPMRESHLSLSSDDEDVARMLAGALGRLFGSQPFVEADAHALRERGLFRRANAGATEMDLIETHISYVLLAPRRVYKIKKPVKYSFLNFSTRYRRFYFCHREVRLNSRLSDIYEGVVAVRRDRRGCFIDDEASHVETRPSASSADIDRSRLFPIVDYAVRMQRLDNRLEMDRMLTAGRVLPEHMQAIARVLARFHQAAEAVPGRADADLLHDEFNDIGPACDAVTKLIPDAAETVSRAMAASDLFLTKHAGLIRRRGEAGYVRDCHGDCHSRNIFLYDDQSARREPVIFDCIEFNDDFRQIDLLNEIAFFCMDLDAFERGDLREIFLEAYLDARWNWPDDFYHENLFQYFLCYRANVRAKVNMLRAAQAQADERLALVGQIRKYLGLMAGYCARF